MDDINKKYSNLNFTDECYNVQDSKYSGEEINGKWDIV